MRAINGSRYRQRPIPDVVREIRAIREKAVLVVDDNLIGTRPEHLARAKDLFRAVIDANLGKEWIAQVTINFADDEELMALARRAGCRGVFIGFESPTPEGLSELGKRFNLAGGGDLRESVRRIQRHNISSWVRSSSALHRRAGHRQTRRRAASHYGVNTSMPCS